MALLPTSATNPNVYKPAQAAVLGARAKSPELTTPKAPTVLPPAQVAPRDLSGTYARTSDGTIINKSSQAKFANEADFFKDSGVKDFNNVKFDDKYTPSGKETIYGQPNSIQMPSSPPPGSINTRTLPNGMATTPNMGGAEMRNLDGSQRQQPYTPPNQGTTGVSQGGIIGNLLGIANTESPQVAKARSDIKGLEENYAKQTANIEGSPIDLSLASGQQGILSRLFAAKQGAAQTALSSALTSQGQQIQANQGAGSLNAPIIVPYGQQQINPSQPTAGATTSGAANISQVVGQRIGADGKTQEFFNSQTGQGFSSPQELADFINQQVPGANANAGNVFQVLEQLKTQQGNNQTGGALNPLNNIASIAQQVISGQISPTQAESMGGSVAGWTGLLNQELQKQAGGAFDRSAAQAAFDANQTVQGGQAQQRAQYQVAHNQAKNLGSQLEDLLRTNGLNPDDINVINSFRQLVGGNTSDWRYVALQNYINDLAATYAQILTPPGGSQTDMVRSIAASMLPENMSSGGLRAVIASLNSAAEAKIAGTNTPSTTSSPTPAPTGNNNSGGGAGGSGIYNW